MTPEELRALDARVAVEVMGLGPIVGHVDAWGECGYDNASLRVGPHPAYVSECVCDSIRTMNANRLASCAERWGWGAKEVDEMKARHATEFIYGHSWQCLAVVREYTTSIADAWLVVEKAKTDGWPVDVGVAFDWDGDPVGYYANFTSEHTARHKDVEVAICKAGLSFFAALKVMEEG